MNMPKKNKEYTYKSYEQSKKGVVPVYIHEHMISALWYDVIPNVTGTTVGVGQIIRIYYIWNVKRERFSVFF